MTHAEQLLAIALPFVWLGLLLGISAIETPLKFKAPGITLELGLGIGRLVFRALNRVELAIAVVLTIVVAHLARSWPLALLVVTDALLVFQVDTCVRGSTGARCRSSRARMRHRRHCTSSTSRSRRPSSSCSRSSVPAWPGGGSRDGEA